MSKFLEEAALKHQRGAEEHKQEWSKESIDYIKEIKEELLDIYNYASLDIELIAIQKWAVETWIDLDERVNDENVQD